MRCFAVCFCFLASVEAAESSFPAVLPDTRPLELTGEIDRQLISGVSKFLDSRIATAREQRSKLVEYTDAKQWPENKNRLRIRLRHILGIREDRPVRLERTGRSTESRLQVGYDVGSTKTVASCPDFDVYSVRWNAFSAVDGEGLLLEPRNEVKANVIAVPDADQSPEQLLGLRQGNHSKSAYPIQLARQGCRVLIPTLISRSRNQFAWHGRRVDVTNREFLYRSAFELGRHIIGYEIQKLLSAIDWFRDQDETLPIAIVGWGEGGALSLYSAALDDRIDVACVSGYFSERESVWQQPVDRNVFGLLEKFGDAELAAMVAPRILIVEASDGPQLELSGGAGAPGRLMTPEHSNVQDEFSRSQEIANRLEQSTDGWSLIRPANLDRGEAISAATLALLLRSLQIQSLRERKSIELTDSRQNFDADRRLFRQMSQLDSHNQAVLRDSRFERQRFMQGLETTSVQEYLSELPRYRKHFAEQVVGRFDLPLLPADARTRKAYDEAKWVGYEVVLDVYPDVIAYGLLLLPKDLRPNEQRPVVVCQHGLEGRPQDVIGEASYHYYKAFAAKLAEQGYITFAPQNLYRHRDEFRVLQRKANPLGKTLFSIITPQHQQIIRWLKTHPNVDGSRIAFYGLSYGGKTAMRVPALLPDYCLSICSADFNEWVDKNASTHNPRSYVWTGEYEIFEFDLGSTFNYAEMAALIAPRPFMVERGHDDGVADDETVAYEFAKVRRRYVKLGIGDRCEIEWFDGPHTIHGQGTFDFLSRHLNWHVP